MYIARLYARREDEEKRIERDHVGATLGELFF